MTTRMVRIAAAALVFLAPVPSPGAQGTPAAKPAAPAAAAATASTGRADVGATLYKKVACAFCHVDEGQGGANGPRIGPDPIPFARFVQYVRRPTGDMPPYTIKVLTDENLADIYAFLQARKRPPAIDTIPQLAR